MIRVAACGVCGSDIKAQPFMPAGMVMGHELGGEVVAVGSTSATGGSVPMWPSYQWCPAVAVSTAQRVR